MWLKMGPVCSDAYSLKIKAGKAELSCARRLCFVVTGATGEVGAQSTALGSQLCHLQNRHNNNFFLTSSELLCQGDQAPGSRVVIEESPNKGVSAMIISVIVIIHYYS